LFARGSPECCARGGFRLCSCGAARKRPETRVKKGFRSSATFLGAGEQHAETQYAEYADHIKRDRHGRRFEHGRSTEYQTMLEQGRRKNAMQRAILKALSGEKRLTADQLYEAVKKLIGPSPFCTDHADAPMWDYPHCYRPTERIPASSTGLPELSASRRRRQGTSSPTRSSHSKISVQYR